MQPKVHRSGLSGLSVFDRGFLSIYSSKQRKFANTATMLAGVAAVGYVGYTFIRGK
jgi:uncharacterized membrane protein YebE (DUF533 family)